MVDAQFVCTRLPARFGLHTFVLSENINCPFGKHQRDPSGGASVGMGAVERAAVERVSGWLSFPA